MVHLLNNDANGVVSRTEIVNAIQKMNAIEIVMLENRIVIEEVIWRSCLGVVTEKEIVILKMSGKLVSQGSDLLLWYP